MHSFTDRNGFPLKAGANMPPTNHATPGTIAATYGQDYSHMYPKSLPSFKFISHEADIYHVTGNLSNDNHVQVSLQQRVHFCCARWSDQILYQASFLYSKSEHIKHGTRTSHILQRWGIPYKHSMCGSSGYSWSDSTRPNAEQQSHDISFSAPPRKLAASKNFYRPGTITSIFITLML